MHSGSTRFQDAGEVRDGWLQLFGRGVEIAQSLCGSGIPLYNLSYSLGALISLAYMNQGHATRFERMVLLAPPVALTPVARLIRFLTPLARVGITLPSAAPANVRARRGTPLSEYAALLQLNRSVRFIDRNSTIGRTQLLAILDRKDELVSYNGVLEWQRRNGLDCVEIETINHRESDRRTYAHLLVLESALGARAWQGLVAAILRHFEPEPA